jgi:ABC-type lipoprotein release transport system permease subunit
MGAVLLVARAGLVARWRATVALAVLVGLGGGAVLAAAAAARRTDEALPAFLDHHRGAQVSVFVDPNPGVTVDETYDYHRRLRGLPMVEDWGLASAAVVALPEVAGDTPLTALVASAVVEGDVLTGFERSLVVEGRKPRPDRADEAAVDETLASTFGLEPGDTLPLRPFAPDQLEAAGNGDPVEPGGDPTEVTVTGVIRRPRDLVIDPQAQPGTIFVANSSDLQLTPAWWERHGDGVATYGLSSLVRLEGGLDGLPAFEAAATGQAGDLLVELDLEGDTAQLDSVRQSIDLTAAGLLAFAAVAGVAALFVVGQALARQVALDAADHPVLVALGMTRAMVVGATLVRSAAVGIVGAALAVALAVAASPLAPVGIARQAELDLGLEADWGVLVPGAAAVALVVVARMALTSWRSSRASTGAPATSDAFALGEVLARVGAPPAAVVGARLASFRGKGAVAASARTALTGVLAGVVAVVAALVVGGSLERLLDRPDLQGWNWDVAVGNYATAERSAAGAAALADNPDVAEFSGVLSAEIGANIDGTEVPVLGVGEERGVVSMPLLSGRNPTGPDEIALAEGTAADLGVEEGDEVTMTGLGGTEVRLRVVGTVVGPAVLLGDADLGSGAVMTLEGVSEASGGVGDEAGSYLVRFREDVDPDAAVARLRQDFPGTLLGPTAPFDLENLRRVDDLPLLLAAVVGVLALGSLAHALVTGVRARRRELAVLRAFGWTRRQVAAAVAWQAAVFVTLALVPGLVLGLALGRWGWRALADSVGSTAGPATAAGALALAVLAVIAVAGLAAAGPGRAAARISPALALRTE